MFGRNPQFVRLKVESPQFLVRPRAATRNSNVSHVSARCWRYWKQCLGQGRIQRIEIATFKDAQYMCCQYCKSIQFTTGVLSYFFLGMKTFECFFLLVLIPFCLVMLMMKDWWPWKTNFFNCWCALTKSRPIRDKKRGEMSVGRF